MSKLVERLLADYEESLYQRAKAIAQADAMCDAFSKACGSEVYSKLIVKFPTRHITLTIDGLTDIYEITPYRTVIVHEDGSTWVRLIQASLTHAGQPRINTDVKLVNFAYIMQSGQPTDQPIPKAKPKTK